jgi:hypothetical protein
MDLPALLARDRDAWSTCVAFLTAPEIGRLNRVHRSFTPVTLQPRVWQACTVELGQAEILHMPPQYRRLVRRLNLAHWTRRTVSVADEATLLSGFTAVDDLGVGSYHPTPTVFGLLSESAEPQPGVAFIRALGVRDWRMLPQPYAHWRFSRVDHLILHGLSRPPWLERDLPLFATVRHLTFSGQPQPTHWSGDREPANISLNDFAAKFKQLERFECPTRSMIAGGLLQLPTTVRDVLIDCDPAILLSDLTTVLTATHLRTVHLSQVIAAINLEEADNLARLLALPFATTASHISLDLSARLQGDLHRMLRYLHYRWPTGRVTKMHRYEPDRTEFTFEVHQHAEETQEHTGVPAVTVGGTSQPAASSFSASSSSSRSAVSPSDVPTLGPELAWTVLYSELEQLEIDLPAVNLESLVNELEARPLTKLVHLTVRIHDCCTPQQLVFVDRLQRHLATLTNLIHPVVRYQAESMRADLQRDQNMSDVDEDESLEDDHDDDDEEEEEERKTNDGVDHDEPMMMEDTTAAPAVETRSEPAVTGPGGDIASRPNPTPTPLSGVWARRVADACEPMELDDDADEEAGLYAEDDDESGAELERADVTPYIETYEKAGDDWAGELAATAAFLEILAEAELPEEDHQRMSEIIWDLTQDQYIEDGENPLYDLSLADFRRIINGYRVSGSPEERKWIQFTAVHEAAVEAQLRSDPNYFGLVDFDPMDGDDPGALDEDEEEREADQEYREDAACAYAKEQLRLAEVWSGRQFTAEDFYEYGHRKRTTQEMHRVDAILRLLRPGEQSRIAPEEDRLMTWFDFTTADLAQATKEHSRWFQLLFTIINDMADEHVEWCERSIDEDAAMTDAVRRLSEALTGLVDRVSWSLDDATSLTASDDSTSLTASEPPESEANLHRTLTELKKVQQEMRDLTTECEEGDADMKYVLQNWTKHVEGEEEMEEHSMPPIQLLQSRLGTRRTYLYEAHQRVLKLLEESEDLPITTAGFWAEQLRECGVAIEQKFGANSEAAVLPPAPFRALVHEIAAELAPEMELEPDAVSYLQQAAEQLLTERFDVDAGVVGAVFTVATPQVLNVYIPFDSAALSSTAQIGGAMERLRG